MFKKRQDEKRGSFDDGKDQSPHVVSPNNTHKVVSIITEERLQIFRKKVHLAFNEARQDIISVVKLAAKVNEDSADPFSTLEIEAGFIQMTDANQVFVADGMVFRI